jgi:hypothetical protein
LPSLATPDGAENSKPAVYLRARFCRGGKTPGFRWCAFKNACISWLYRSKIAQVILSMNYFVAETGMIKPIGTPGCKGLTRETQQNAKSGNQLM